MPKSMPEDLSETDWSRLLTRIRRELESIIRDSGYGSVSIKCAAGSPHEIHSERSLRVASDVLEDTVPSMA